MNDLTWQRLIPAEYHRILPLFEGYLGDPLMHAVIESRRPGQIYADERHGQRPSAFMWQLIRLLPASRRLFASYCKPN